MKTVLFFGDSPAVSTGLGIVAREIIARLTATGRYRFVCWGMNHWLPYVDVRQFPYPIYAAGVNRHGDSLGRRDFWDLAEELPHDALFTVADLQVVGAIGDEYRKRVGTKPWIAYLPVDAELIEDDVKHLVAVTHPVAYTEYGARQLARFGLSVPYLYHGCDTEVFRPLPPEERRRLRAAHFGLDDSAFLVMAVARNQWRKDLVRTMLGFKFFREMFPEAKLYLHAKIQDQGGDLTLQAKAVGLEKKDVIFTPQSFNEVRGVPTETLARLYACADAVVSTALGEGWGMSTTEAFAAGTPFLGPRNTSLEEIVGPNEERGWLADCGRDFMVAYGNDYHLRPLTDLGSWVAKLSEIRQAPRREVRKKTAAARAWVEAHNWDEVGKRWVQLFDEVLGG